MKVAWQTKTLGDLCRFIDYRGKTPVKTSNGLRLITAKNVKMGHIQTEPLEFVNPGTYSSWMTRGIPKKGDVLFTTEAPLANVAQLDTDEKVVFAQRIIVLQPIESALDRTFLKYLLLSDGSQGVIRSKGTGATVQGIKASLLKTIEVHYPPLPEQQRIVTLLDEAFAGIATAKANAEKNLQNARDLFASHLQTIFSRYEEGWTVRTVRQLVSEGILAKPQDGNHGEIHPTKADYVDDGVPFIMAADLSNGVVDTENCRFISEKQASTLRIGFAKPGDVLLSHKGTIGRVANLATNDDFIVLTPQVTYYRSLNGQRLNNGFLYYCLLSPVFQTEMNRIADSGSTRAYIGITRQLDLQISLPSINIQHELVARLRNIQENSARLESICQNKITALDELKKSLLHRAFTGHLT